ncbi:MAG: hypothetical protein K5922_07810 [Clostridiales bacterium]|nr:hypothetical protein [Clostridiales bacterium]
MKAYFLPLGTGADSGLSALLSAMSCGAARQAPSVNMLRISAASPEELPGRMIRDLQLCHALFAGKDAFAFFRTEWQTDVWCPELPERDALVENEESRLLLRAVRGEGVPFSFRTDREAAEWSMSALLEKIPEDPAGFSDSGLQPFLTLLSALEKDLRANEDVRIMMLCDLSEGWAAGVALALMRFFRMRFSGEKPFLGLICQNRAFGTAAEEGARDTRDALAALSGRNLIRAAEGRDTLGADACWMLGLPASFMTGEESCLLLDWCAARVLGEVWTGHQRPSFGLHLRELSGVLTLQTLDQEARPAAAFLRGAFWCLSDLFPSLRSYMEHPALLRSLAPATRGGLFRRLFREGGDMASAAGELTVLERTMRVLCLQILSLIQSLPPLMKEEALSSDLWKRAVQACGRTVTLGSEYDVRRKEAEESGIDRVQPVHRVSLSDTEEEELLRKLDTMLTELSAAETGRAEVFRQLGGYYARAALEDCRDKCRAAEASARDKLVEMPAGTPEERYALGMQERRVRLLKAAVSRCGEDLAAATAWPVLSQPGVCRTSAPFAGEILDPDLAGQALTLLTSEGEAAETAARTLRDGIGGLLKGYPLNDAKMLLKNLLSVCRQPESESPLRSLMAGVFSVCGVEVSGLRFRSVGDLPAVPLLPDLTEGERFFTLAAAPSRILAPAPEDRIAWKRGLLALIILRQYRRRNLNEASLSLLPLRPESSVLTRVWLSSRGADQAVLVSLRSGEGEQTRSLPLAILLPGLGLEPARLQSALLDLIPSFAFWTDREKLCFRDPCVYLSEGDRQILTEQLTRLRAELKSPRSRDLASFLSDWHQDIMQAPRQSEDQDDLRQRLRIACGLTRLPVWQKDLQRVSAFYEASLSEDPVCAALSGTEAFEAAGTSVREDNIYVFRGTPVSRENADCLLESTHAPEEQLYLASLNTECEILSHSSDDYHEALAAGLQDLLQRFPGADPEAVKTARELLKEAQEPVSERMTELNWPWDTMSASVLTILTECLGPELAAPALRAFSERLVLIPARGGEILGDVLLSQMCLLRNSASSEPEENAQPSPEIPPAEENAPEAEIRADAVLPPLHPDFARALCRSPRGQSLIQPGFLRVEREGFSVRAELSLEGAFTLKLVRVYAPEEILSLYAHDLPTLALWPSLPFAADSWHVYASYAHCGPDFRFTAVSMTEEVALSGTAPRLAAVQREFPLCYLVYHQDLPVGAVPNLLPPTEIPAGGAWTACLDFGASGVSVIFTDGVNRWPMQGPVTVRTLMRSPASTEMLLWQEFLPAVPVSALLPCALRIFRNHLTEDDLPLRDSAIFMSSSLRDVLSVPSEALYTDLKWNGEKGKASRLYLHQAMLMAALQARCGGASALSWRAALPEEMAAEGRIRLAETVRSLAEEVSAESGLPFPEKGFPVVFAAESAALGAYFRFCSPDQTRGGFMALDQGADTADLSLYLQGRPDAVRCCQLPMGLHNMLLPALLRNPALLQEDFGFVEDAGFRQDLAELQAVLEKARREPAALRHARYGLDAMLADHFPLLLQALQERRGAGSPGRTGALILLHEGFLMMLSGLVLLGISGDSLRNDTLPDQMTVFLAGRGSALIESLSLQAKTSLWKLLTMFRNTRVRSLTLVFSAEKKLEIPVGLSVMDHLTASPPHSASAPAAIAVRPEELMPEFLLRFRREFPDEAALLFPGVYANDYYSPFTPYGQQLLAQALQAAFDRRETGKPIPSLVFCLTHLLDLIQEGTPLS